MNLSIFSKQNSIKSATSILIITLTLSNFLGLVRDHFLAQKITTDLLDTYYAAFRIPDLIFNTIILGAVSAAFIPTYTRLIANKENSEANHVASSVVSIGMLTVFLLSVVIFFLMPIIVPILVPLFSPEKQTLTLELSRYLLLSPVFFGLSYFSSAILNSYKRFLVSSLAPLIYNISIIFSTIMFSDQYGVKAVVYGVLIGALLHMSIQLLPLGSLGVRLKLVFDLSSLHVRRIGKLMIPRSIGLGSMQMMLASFTAIASGLGGGAVAIYNLADNIQTMPTVVFGTSVASALFPTLAQNFSLGKIDEFIAHLQKAIISILFYLVPATVGIILLRAQIIRLILGSGNFGWEQTISASQTLGFFAISLVFSGLVPLLARSFYALHNTKTPMVYSIISVGISILFGLYFGKMFGVPGLALAFSIGSFINFILLYFGLKLRLPDFNEGLVWSALGRIMIGTIAMALAIQLVKISVGTIYDLDTFLEVGSQMAISGAIGVAVYFSTTYILGLKDMDYFGLDKLIKFIIGGFSGKKDS